MMSRRLAVLLVLLCGLVDAPAQGPAQDPKSLLTTLLAHEDQDARQRGRYLYRSEERSDRTGGHLWTEWVAETTLGRVRYLVAEDGVPLNPERTAAERARLADIAAHPDAFQRKEQAQKNDELRAKQLLQLLPKAFLFDAPVQEGAYLRIGFRPNPEYAPQTLEERVLCAMTGSFLVEPKAVRLHAIEGRLPADVSLGFGFLATIKAGSSFSTTRDRVEGDDWKTTVLDTDINGRAIFFKALARKQHSVHEQFKRLPDDLPFAQAVVLAQSHSLP